MSEMVIAGQVVSIVSKAYDSFKDNSGGVVSGGVTHKAYIVTDAESAPSEVKIPSGLVEVVKGHIGKGPISLIVRPFARNNRLTFTLDRVGSKPAA